MKKRLLPLLTALALLAVARTPAGRADGRVAEAYTATNAATCRSSSASTSGRMHMLWRVRVRVCVGAFLSCACFYSILLRTISGGVRACIGSFEDA